MLIYITRHGETEWNIQNRTQGAQNTQLTDKGRFQAVLLANRLKKNNSIKKIYCSDLSRAYETAQIIGNKLNISPTSSRLIREASFGIWEGHTTGEINKIYKGELDRWYNDFSFSPADGESIIQIQKRVSSFISFIADDIENDVDILLVSHALVSKILLLRLLDMPIKYIRNIKFDNVGLSIIKVVDNKKTIVLHNDTCHLTTF